MTVIYFDGAERRSTEAKGYDIGVGIVMVSEGNVEGYSLNTFVKVPGAAEYIAFAFMAETLRFRTDVRKARLFTDCSPIANAKEALHPGNNKGALAYAIESLFDRFTYKTLGINTQTQLAWLKILSIEEVKGHSGVVYNEYADYLAKCAINHVSAFLSFDDWARQPRRYWDSQKEQYDHKYLPFCSPDNND